MTADQKTAYDWAKAHPDYRSIAAGHARELAGLVDELMEELRPWRDASIEVPVDNHDVLVLVSGQYVNITFDHAPMLGVWLGQEGWYLNEYPMWDKPSVTHWMEIPEPPEEEQDG